MMNILYVYIYIYLQKLQNPLVYAAAPEPINNTCDDHIFHTINIDTRINPMNEALQKLSSIKTY